jgi:hypothetical protein
MTRSAQGLCRVDRIFWDLRGVRQHLAEVGRLFSVKVSVTLCLGLTSGYNSLL